MKCKECSACHKVGKFHECWGVKEPFIIKDINSECTEYSEKREMSKCKPNLKTPNTDPCIYKEIEVHKNVTVRVNKCINCGELEYRWERQPDTISEYKECVDFE